MVNVFVTTSNGYIGPIFSVRLSIIMTLKFYVKYSILNVVIVSIMRLFFLLIRVNVVLIKTGVLRSPPKLHRDYPYKANLHYQI